MRRRGPARGGRRQASRSGSACARRACRSPFGWRAHAGKTEPGPPPRGARPGHRGGAAGHRKHQAAGRLARRTRVQGPWARLLPRARHPLHPAGAVSQTFRGHVESAGVPRIALKNLCESASLALPAGVNPKVVSERLGHATVSSRSTPTATCCPGFRRTPPLAWRRSSDTSSGARLQSVCRLRCQTAARWCLPRAVAGYSDGPCRNRTYNLEIKSLLLCQLS
jgi:hypothetical protein